MTSTKPAGRFLAAFLIILCFATVFNCFSVPAFAEDALGANEQSIKNGLTKGLDSAYSIIKVIVGPIGAIAICVCAFKLIFGGSKGAEETKATLIRIIVAMAIVFLGPMLVSSITTWFTGKSISEAFGSAGAAGSPEMAAVINMAAAAFGL